MNELIMLMQASNKLDDVVGMLAYIAKDLKASLSADNAELKEIKNEIASLKRSLELKTITNKTKSK